MKIINLYAGPGSGKSTGAAYLFSRMKMAGIESELITEYAKRKVYEKSYAVLDNQIYMTGKQYKTMKDLQVYGVPVAVTDSPLLLGLYYGQNLPYFNEYSALLCRLSQEFDNVNVFVERHKPYDPKGRMQTEEESDAISHSLKQMVGIDKIIPGTQYGYDNLFSWLIERGHIPAGKCFDQRA